MIFVISGVFLDKGFKFQPDVCNRCHDLLLISISLSDIAILDIKSVDYCCIISEIRKIVVVNLIQNADFTEKNRTL